MTEPLNPNPLDQYISLFREHSKLLDENSAGALNKLRPRALEALEGKTLPKKGAEDYENIDVSAMLAPDYGVNLARILPDINPAATFRCGVPNMSTALFLTLNDMPVKSDTADRTLPDGVLAGSLRTLAQEYPELTARFYGKFASLDNPLTALNTLLVQDGFMLYVPKGVHVEKPLQLVNILQNNLPLLAFRRLLIVVEEDASATLLACDHTQAKDIDMMALQTVEIFAGRNARFDLYDLEESAQSTKRVSTLYLHQEEGSNVLIDSITLFNGTTRNEFYCDFRGEGAELHLLGMGIEDDERVLSTHSLVNHFVGRCHTDELFKYVVDDCAVGDFSGRIFVGEGAVKTTAYQANRNIVGSDQAKMFSKPQLEIYNDDVKCSHGTAIGQLNELQLFYMRTRGLDEKEAKLLLKQAFMADVVDAVRMESLKDRLRQLVERRFSGIAASCSSCDSACIH